ncbi:hypothetical protein [Kiloniella sp.]|uniref:hypothetical protein n=1 Tax=Kiloniella sp. TaxID=1938587 RepID=UPI003B02C777
MIRIFDGNNHVRRRLETDPSGLPIKTLYEEVMHCDGIPVYVFDGAGSLKARREIFPGYKVGRKPGGEQIYKSMNMFRELLSLSRAIVIQVPGYEADDIIAKLAIKYRDEGHSIHIHSNDGDFLQIDNVERDSKDYKGVPPRWIRLYKATVGDSSDKIPGIPNFGVGAWHKLSDLNLLEKLEKLVVSGNHEDLPVTKGVQTWLQDELNRRQLFQYYQIVGFLPVSDELIEEHTVVGNPLPDAFYSIIEEHLLIPRDPDPTMQTGSPSVDDFL